MDHSERQKLIEQWSPLVKKMLGELGNKTWPPLKERKGIFAPETKIPRFLIEGPVAQDSRILWAVSHTRRPSTFELDGKLSEGLREYWAVSLIVESGPMFAVEGAESLDGIPTDQASLKNALFTAASQFGPRLQKFYGNKGPLTQK